jgi:hypothetical protein
MRQRIMKQTSSAEPAAVNPGTKIQSRIAMKSRLYMD